MLSNEAHIKQLYPVAVLIIYLLLFRSILANTLHGYDSVHLEHSLLSQLRFHRGTITSCLLLIGTIPPFKTTLYILHGGSTPTSPVVFTISMVINPIPSAICFSIICHVLSFACLIMCLHASLVDWYLLCSVKLDPFFLFLF